MVECLKDPSGNLDVDLSPGRTMIWGKRRWTTVTSWSSMDQREICDLVQEYLSSEGYYRVSTAQDGAGMRRVMAQSAIDLVILDLVLPGEACDRIARPPDRERNGATGPGSALDWGC
jgi:hypothetical protein